MIPGNPDFKLNRYALKSLNNEYLGSEEFIRYSKVSAIER